MARGPRGRTSHFPAPQETRPHHCVRTWPPDSRARCSAGRPGQVAAAGAGGRKRLTSFLAGKEPVPGLPPVVFSVCSGTLTGCEGNVLPAPS